MKPSNAFKSRLILLALFLTLALSACRQPAAGQAPAATSSPATTETQSTIPPYRNPALPVNERVEDLLARMTLAEKIGQMTLVEKDSIVKEDISALFIGGLLSGGGGSPARNNPAGWAEMVADFQSYAGQTRLAIPLLYGVDAIHGHNNVVGAVIFPHNIGLGATRDAELVERIGRITAVEVRATGIPWNYAPVLAVPQDIRWGRTYEGYSENTELVTLLATAYLRGLQGDDLSAATAVLGTPKHYLADGGTGWETSQTNDYKLDQGDTVVDEATLRAVHLPPYQAAIDAGALSIMVSYSRWNGLHLHAHDYLLTDVLKGELGFDGFLVSDWGAIDQIPGEYYHDVVTAVNAGIDMNMVPYNYELFIYALTSAVENGDVAEARIDDAVSRILTAKFELGLFDRPAVDESQLALVGSEAHRELAREAVAKSAVLLKNEDNLLPLSPEMGLIFVAGVGADDIGLQSGGWTIEWQGREGNITPGTTLLDAIEGTVSAGTTVQYNRFGRYERITDSNGEPAIADVGIAVVAEKPYAEGMGDAADLALAEADINMIERLRERSQKLVVVILSGRPLIITDHIEAWDAVVAAWLPGSEGQGVADLLFGAFPFQGQLPYTWPRSMGQLDGSEGGEPLFPYGYGLRTD